MEAVLFYSDNWFSSPSVRQMDAAERGGYFQLLLLASKSEDCGLPLNEKYLALESTLRTQWDKQTIDEDYRFDSRTSGQKILACFFEVDGRIYNKRLLEVWTQYKERQEQRKSASQKGVEARRRSGQLPPFDRPKATKVEHLVTTSDSSQDGTDDSTDRSTDGSTDGVTEREPTRVRSESKSTICTSQSTSELRTDVVLLAPGVQQNNLHVLPYRRADPSFDLWVEAKYALHPKKRDKAGAIEALQYFRGKPELQKTFDAAHDARRESVEWTKEGGRYCPTLASYVNDEEWLGFVLIDTPEPRGLTAAQILEAC